MYCILPLLLDMHMPVFTNSCLSPVFRFQSRISYVPCFCEEKLSLVEQALPMPFLENCAIYTYIDALVLLAFLLKVYTKSLHNASSFFAASHLFDLLFLQILQLLLAGGSLLIKECTIFCCKEKSQLQQRIIWFSVSYQVISDVLFCLKWLKYLKSIVLLSNSENPWFPSYLVLLMRHLHGNSGWWVCVINL